MKRYIVLTFFILLFVPVKKIFASDIMTEKEYREQMSMDVFPDILNINTYADWEDYQIRIMGQPTVTVSTSSLRAYDDKKFLILRMGIKNISENPIVWLDPKSFHVQEYYLDFFGSTYGLNHIMSAKASQASSLPPFYSVIQPNSELLTVLVFEVYGEVDGWILTFNPFTREDEQSDNAFSFVLPKVLYQ